jgi:hypothetical protein
MQKSYYIDNDNKPSTTNNKEKDKKNRIISRDKRNNYFLCSSLSFNEYLSNSMYNINNISNINANEKNKNKNLKNRVNMKLSSFTLNEKNFHKLNKYLTNTNKGKSKS